MPDSAARLAQFHTQQRAGIDKLITLRCYSALSYTMETITFVDRMKSLSPKVKQHRYNPPSHSYQVILKKLKKFTDTDGWQCMNNMRRKSTPTTKLAHVNLENRNLTISHYNMQYEASNSISNNACHVSHSFTHNTRL